MAISFQGAHGPQDIMLMGGRWYVASPWRSRHGEALLEARGVPVDPATRQRWVGQDSPLVAKAWHRRTCPVWVSWRLAEPYRQGKGPWYSLSGAVDPHGQTMDFLLTEHRATEAALRLLTKAIRRNGLPAPMPSAGSDAHEAASKR